MSDFFNGWDEDGEPMSDNLIERLRDAGQQINALANESGWTIADEAADALEAKDKRIAELEREIRVLRQYGNKDCTAMADEALEALKGDNDES